MGVFSGKNGKVLAGSSSISDVTKWDFNTESNTHRYASSSTAGYKRTIDGTHQGDGSIDGKVNDGTTTVLTEGASVTLKLYEDSTRFWLVPAVIKNVKRTVDMDSGEEVGFTAAFETDGAWTPPTNSQ